VGKQEDRRAVAGSESDVAAKSLQHANITITGYGHWGGN
jgi:hypothetical protein